MPEFLSIGIPARNEQDSIEMCIKWITRSIAWKQAPSTEKELIVCINGSTDKTAQIVRNLAKQIPEIKLIELKEAGKNQAINTIVAHSSKRADAIYFSDADVLVKRDTIGKVLKELRANPKIEFAAPIVVPSAAFFPAKKRSPTAALYGKARELVGSLKHTA